ncbi:MAG: M48 family metalloprotease [Thaumarchaeota archaeon]|nr:M48 family metalloprotease [Nitrososphaerota archaeon]
MSFVDVVVTYFTSQPFLVTLALLLSSLALLFSLFIVEKHRPKRRLQILSASFAVEVLTWSFLGSGLLFCAAFVGLYNTGGDWAAVRTVFGLSVLASLLVALPLSAFVTLKVPGAVARRLTENLLEPQGAVAEAGGRLAKSFGVTSVRLLQSPSGVPFAYSVAGEKGVVVVSEGLVVQLDGDEVETVLAHELAHLKNHDAALNTVVAVYRRVLFFDPFIRILEGAIYGEKEFSADELSARATKKPLSLASALLKISSGQSGGRWLSVKIEGLPILGSSKLVRPPSVKRRVERLVELAAELDEGAVLPAGALYAS